MNVIDVFEELKPTSPLIPLNLDNILNIVIHHPESSHCTWQDINKWHKRQGWNCAGYNEYIRKSGTVYILRGDHIGAQCQGHNSSSYGICCEGNYEVETMMSDIQKQVLVERIQYNKARFRNYKLTGPHSLFYPTDCPGKYFPMADILKKVEVVKVEENKSHWAQESLDYLKSKGIVINEIRFDDKITRAEILVLLAQVVKICKNT